ncbi:hypothetical protein Tco_0127854 [Tanacetum coccineum]
MNQWTGDKRKAANLDQRLKSLIMSVLPDDQMNSVINCLTAKSTWDDLILYHEGPSNVKESRVMDLKLCYNTFKFKKERLKADNTKRILGADQLTEDPSSSRKKDLVFVKSSADDTKVSILGVERPCLSKAEGFILPNHDTGRILPAESQINTTNPSVAVTDSLATDYDSAKEVGWIISLEREINPRNPQHAFKRCEACDSSTHTTTNRYDIEWFKRGEALQAKKAEALKSTRDESSNANRSKTPTRSGCSRHMTGVKSYLHKYVEQPRPKVVFGYDSTCTTEGYGSIKFYIHNHKDHLGKFDEKADDGYLLRYSLISKAFRVFNTRRQQTKETYPITFDESPDASKFLRPLVDNINITETGRYPSDEYLHLYEPSQRYQTNNNDVSFIEPYECPELICDNRDLARGLRLPMMDQRGMPTRDGTKGYAYPIFVWYIMGELGCAYEVPVKSGRVRCGDVCNPAKDGYMVREFFS